MDMLASIAYGFWTTLAEMAPYLLFGFAVAGVLSVLISPEVVERHLGTRGSSFLAVLKATLFGIPLPLCSCGVIPVAASLKRSGAGSGATTAFLISTPQTGVDSILVTYSLLGPVFAVFRPLVALVSGVIGGSLVSAIVGEDAPAPPKQAPAHCAPKRGGRAAQALRYGFVALPRDIGSAMLLGLVIAGLITALLPPDYFQKLLAPLAEGMGRTAANLASMVGMMLVAIPIYVCATASVPIAAALIVKGISPGAALVFLMTGPATNAATIATIWKVMGRKTAMVYLATVSVLALAAGTALDLMFPGLQSSMEQHLHAHGIPLYKTLSAVVLLAVLLGALVSKYMTKTAAKEADMGGDVTLTIKGMTCSHCAGSVQRALSGVEGVTSAEVDLGSGKAVVRGEGLDPARLAKAVEELGYSAAAG